MFQRFTHPIATFTATMLLGVCALLAAVIFAGRPLRTIVPLVFVLLVVAGAARYGVMVGILGSLLGAAIFARYLFPPIGSLQIEATVARANIGWMLLGGISLSYLFAGTGISDKHKHHHK